MSLDVTVINPEVAAGDRDVSVWLTVEGGALVLSWTKGGRGWSLPLADLESASVSEGVEQNLATVLKELTA